MTPNGLYTDVCVGSTGSTGALLILVGLVYRVSPRLILRKLLSHGSDIMKDFLLQLFISRVCVCFLLYSVFVLHLFPEQSES